MQTFAEATKKLSTGANGHKEDDAASFFCQCSFDRVVMVAQWYDLRLETRETRVRTLLWASSHGGHVTTRSGRERRCRDSLRWAGPDCSARLRAGCSWAVTAGR